MLRQDAWAASSPTKPGAPEADGDSDGELYPLAVEGAETGESSTDLEADQPRDNGASSPKAGISYAAATAGNSPKQERAAIGGHGAGDAAASAATPPKGEAAASGGRPARPGSATQRSPAGQQPRRSSGTATPPRKVRMAVGSWR